MKLMLTSDTHYGCNHKTHNKHEKTWKKISKEIKENDVKALIWAGDLAANRQRQFYRSLEQARKYIDIPILLVRGNHDLWDGIDKKDKNYHKKTLEQVYENHEKWFQEFDIHHLEKEPFILDDVLICGFDGWYAGSNPPTNDFFFVPEFYNGLPSMSSLPSRSYSKFMDCLDLDLQGYRKSIIVTHHNLYPFRNISTGWPDSQTMDGNVKFMDPIKDKFDILCCGHTHEFRDVVEDGLRILNCGSDYNSFKYLIFDV